MIRCLTRRWLLGVMVCAAATPALAQHASRPNGQPVTLIASASVGELHGIIEDDKGRPLAGAVVSALGSTTAFAVSDRQGRFSFRNLPAGPYLVRAHLQGYSPARGRVVQVTTANRSAYTISLTRTGADEEPMVLTAGVGGGDAAPVDDAEDQHEHGEVAWRLRHQKRSVLKETNAGSDFADASLIEGSLDRLGRAIEGPTRLASALFADLSLNGQFNLLTTSSFDRPQELFLLDGAVPRGVAYLSLTAPGRNGEWQMRGTITQGDVSSWVVAGSYRRAADAAHAYEAGLFYSTQQYAGGNGEALFAIRDGSRNVGAIYAYDNWALLPRVRVGYGARFSRYDYLPDESLVSPRASLSVQPLAGDSLVLRATFAHRETAPGAEEFSPPAIGPWLPPERTFSQISRTAFRPERLDHVELAAERELGGDLLVGVSAFRQHVDDQVVTLFGLKMADAQRGIGHYHVASAGDFEARGWTVSASRSVGEAVRAGVDYTRFETDWTRPSPDLAALATLAPSVLRKAERIHDVTASLETVIAASATRFFILYKLNTGFAEARDTTPSALRSVRFNVQVNQSLPFLNVMDADW
jgi:hypothetical protein